MRQIRSLGSLFLADALIAPAVSVGCTARASHGVRFYIPTVIIAVISIDRSYWQYLGEKHHDYRGFSKLNQKEQTDYWNWRHGQPDSDSR
jgi:hypothetical protein